MDDMSTEQSRNAPPHSKEAEQTVLGAILKNNEIFELVEGIITPTDFYYRNHEIVFDEIVKMLTQNKPLDPLILAQIILEKKLELQISKSVQEYLEDLADFAGSSAGNLLSYAHMIRDRSVLRSLSKIAADISRDAFDPQGRSSEMLLDEAERKILAISDTSSLHREGFESIQPIVKDVLKHLDSLSSKHTKTGLIGISTGFADLDKMTQGLQKGDLIIVAGRPSMGKTAFSLNLAEHVALKEGKTVAIFSLEMSREQLGTRLISSYSGIAASALRSADLTEEEWSKLSIAASAFYNNRIFIDDTGGLNTIAMRSRARRLKREQPDLGLIIIDYIQLMNGARQTDNRVTEVGDISRAIKALARELDVPVIALSQLSRKVEERSDKRPVMSDLRESGAIEQDADLILMLFREEYYKPEDQTLKGLAELIIGKQRNGPTGTIKLVFTGEHMRFHNYANAQGFA